jgi:hypothetical protein
VSDGQNSADGYVAVNVDTTTEISDLPPYPPDGVFSITGDEVVTVCWNQKTEPNIVAYGIYKNTELWGAYTWIANVNAVDACSDGLCCFDDAGLNNGETWYYAVTSINNIGMESEDLSYENVFDTPRPEDFGLVLVDFGQDAAQSGYDFSSLSNAAQPWNSISTDIYFGVSGGTNYIFTTARVDIQDYGWIDLLNVDWAPSGGWAPSGIVEAIPRHSYIVRINGLSGWNVAKFEVVSVTSDSVTMDWAYQGVPGLPELAPGAEVTK